MYRLNTTAVFCSMQSQKRYCESITCACFAKCLLQDGWTWCIHSRLGCKTSGLEQSWPPGTRWRCGRVSAGAARAALANFRRQRRRRSQAEAQSRAGSGERCHMLTSPPCESRSSPTRMSSSSSRTRTWRKAAEERVLRLWSSGDKPGRDGGRVLPELAPVAGLSPWEPWGAGPASRPRRPHTSWFSSLRVANSIRRVFIAEVPIIGKRASPPRCQGDQSPPRPPTQTLGSCLRPLVWAGGAGAGKTAVLEIGSDPVSFVQGHFLVSLRLSQATVVPLSHTYALLKITGSGVCGLGFPYCFQLLALNLGQVIKLCVAVLCVTFIH